MKDSKDEEVFRKLDEFHVEVPDFPMKKTQMDKVADWLFDSVRLPEVSLTEKGMAFTLFLPIIISVISVLPFIIL